jgi:hypothetical protein
MHTLWGGRFNPIVLVDRVAHIIPASAQEPKISSRRFILRLSGHTQ